MAKRKRPTYEQKRQNRAAAAARASAASEAVAAPPTAASTNTRLPPASEPSSQEVDMDISDREDYGPAMTVGASAKSGTAAPLEQGTSEERRNEGDESGRVVAETIKDVDPVERIWTFDEDEQLIRLRSAGIASQDITTFLRLDSKLGTVRLQKLKKQQKEHDARVAKGDPPWYMHGRPLPRLLPMSGARAVEPAAAKDKFGVPLVASSIGPLAWTDEDDAALRAARAAALAAGQRSWKAIPWSFGRTRWAMKLRWELKEREWAAAGLIPALDTLAPADATASASAVRATPAVPAAAATGAVSRRNHVDLSSPPPPHVPSRSGPWTAEEDRKLLQLKLQLLSSKEIAREVRRSRTAVATRCRELQDGWLAANLLPKKLMLPPIPAATAPQPPNLPHASASTTPAPPSALPPPAPPTPPICTIDALVREYDGPLMRFVDYSSPSPPPAKRPRLAVSPPIDTQPEQVPAALATQDSAHAPTSAASASASPTSSSAWTPASHAKLLELRREGVSRERCALILGMPEKVVKASGAPSERSGQVETIDLRSSSESPPPAVRAGEAVGADSEMWDAGDAADPSGRGWRYEEDDLIIRLRSCGIVWQDIATFLRLDLWLVSSRLETLKRLQAANDARLGRGEQPRHLYDRPLPRFSPPSTTAKYDPAGPKDAIGVPLIASSMGPLAWTDADDAALRAARAGALKAGSDSWDAVVCSFGRTRWAMKLRWELKEETWLKAGLVRPHKKWTSELDAAMLRLRLEGVDWKTMAQQLGKGAKPLKARFRKVQEPWIAAGLLPQKLALPPIPPPAPLLLRLPPLRSLSHPSKRLCTTAPRGSEGGSMPSSASPAPPARASTVSIAPGAAPSSTTPARAVGDGPPPSKRPRLSSSTSSEVLAGRPPSPRTVSVGHTARASESTAGRLENPPSVHEAQGATVAWRDGPWMPEEDTLLLQDKSDGVSSERSALILGRSQSAVLVRLLSLRRKTRTASEGTTAAPVAAAMSDRVVDKPSSVAANAQPVAAPASPPPPPAPSPHPAIPQPALNAVLANASPASSQARSASPAKLAQIRAQNPALHEAVEGALAACRRLRRLQLGFLWSHGVKHGGLILGPFSYGPAHFGLGSQLAAPPPAPGQYGSPVAASVPPIEVAEPSRFASCDPHSPAVQTSLSLPPPATQPLGFTTLTPAHSRRSSLEQFPPWQNVYSRRSSYAGEGLPSQAQTTAPSVARVSQAAPAPQATFTHLTCRVCEVHSSRGVPQPPTIPLPQREYASWTDAEHEFARRLEDAQQPAATIAAHLRRSVVSYGRAREERKREVRDVADEQARENLKKRARLSEVRPRGGSDTLTSPS
ncbi:hypothetical protein JCM10450v2_007890 [Rhodotorula kratochvilovae]